jgi:hypothetical protein
MTTPNTSAPLQMAQFQQCTMAALTGRQTDELCGLFQVPVDQIRLVSHPLNNDRCVIKIQFLYGINVAAALALFFNRELYGVPKHEQARDLHIKQNAYAFVDLKASGEVLCLTVGEPVERFLAQLKARESDIHYVIENPQILFMLRRDLDYRTAHANVQRSFEPGP